MANKNSMAYIHLKIIPPLLGGSEADIPMPRFHQSRDNHRICQASN